MRTASFVGKLLDLDQAKQLEEFDYISSDEQDEHYEVAEIYLNEFDYSIVDKTGRNAYSMQIVLDGRRIIKIIRIGHCHMCGGQGSDDELRRFPHATLEKEAHKILTKLTSEA